MDNAEAMNLDQVLGRLSLSRGAAALLAPHWDESCARFHDDSAAWMRDQTLGDQLEFAAFDPCWRGPLLDVARVVRGHADLSRLVLHMTRLAFEYLDYDMERARQWPELIPALGDRTPLLWVLVAFEALPRMRRAHGRRGIPENVSRDTCSYFREAARLHALSHGGQVGLLPSGLAWLRNHASGDLCCLGRLEFMIRPFKGKVRAYRHRGSGLVVALADTGCAFDGSGLGAIPGPSGQTPDTGEAVLTVTDNDIIGHLIPPDGRAMPEKIRLQRQEWSLSLSPGDPVLEVHIPPGGGMTPARCADSMGRALEFFPRHFPEARFPGFACRSWILNPELAEYYSPASNMVLWQRELHLFPVPSNGRSGLHFVFGREDIDIATAPRDTSLKRALLDRLAAGLPLREGGMFCLTGEFGEYGCQPYRRQWPAVRALLGL